MEQFRIDNEAGLGENEDKEYDADTESDHGGAATEPTTAEEPKAHPYSRSNLVPTHPSAKTPNLPRFDQSAVLGTEGHVRRQKAWIDSQVAIEKAREEGEELLGERCGWGFSAWNRLSCVLDVIIFSLRSLLVKF